jgi:outer membrane protein
MVRTGVRWTVCAAAIAAVLRIAHGEAETLESALAQAYRNNPTLNAQRAALRATDEGVPQALAGYRPRVNGSSIPATSTSNRPRCRRPSPRPTPISARAAATSAGADRLQRQRTGNLTRQAEAPVLRGRETLRNAEQVALLDAATAYMNVLRDTAILDLQRRNVQVLQEQLKQTRDRFNVGEVTRTDVAQSEARLAARSRRCSPRGEPEGVAGDLPPRRRRRAGQLRAGMPVDRLSPRTLERDRAGRSEHPTVAAAQYTVDAAQYAVKAAEGSLYPTVTLEAAAQKRWDLAPGTASTS